MHWLVFRLGYTLSLYIATLSYYIAELSHYFAELS